MSAHTVTWLLKCAPTSSYCPEECLQHDCNYVLLSHLFSISEYPSLQWHWYEPSVLPHLCSQYPASGVAHSSMSASVCGNENAMNNPIIMVDERAGSCMSYITGLPKIREQFKHYVIICTGGHYEMDQICGNFHFSLPYILQGLK